ncbi:MAG: MHYT domain-containing protein, partial [Betaproteobacteria bacterium]
MPNLPISHDPPLLACALLIAGFACYVALDAVLRMRDPDKRLQVRWWITGAVAMGTGLWAANFTALLAFSLPIALGYQIGFTALSWAAAVAASAIALFVASFDQLAWPRLWTGALAVGLGLAAMHYLGLAALALAPAIAWNWQVVIASVVVAICASATVLEAFFLVRKARRSQGYLCACAAVMGGAVAALHAIGMAGASFHKDTFCLSEGGLS